MVRSFRSQMEATVPDNVKSSLPEGLLELVKEDPPVLMDLVTAQALKETVVEAVDITVASSLLNSLDIALKEALSDVSTVLWIAVALPFLVALFRHGRPVELQQDSGLEARA